MVESRRTSHRVQAVNSALLAAATYCQLLRHLASDGCLVRKPGRKRFDGTLEVSEHLIRVDRLVFASATEVQPVPTFRTLAFLSRLPADFVKQLTRAVPPVVSPLPGDGTRFAVLGNVLSGFLASRCLPGEMVSVRFLNRSTGPRWSPVDLLSWGDVLRESIVARHRVRIAQLAPSLEVAELITGMSRASAARYRQADGAGSAADR